MKKISVLLVFALVVTFMFASCAKTAEPEPITEPTGEPIPDIVGGFSTEGAIAGSLSEAAKTAYDEATAGIDAEYAPLGCVGSQVVAGMNYAILVKDGDSLKVLFIYKPLNDKASITETADFNMLDYLNDSIEIVKADEDIVGGWGVPTDGGLTAMPQGLASATSKAFSEYKDLIINPIACVGTQVVAGTNYALVCAGKTDEDARSNLYMVKLYDGVDGTNEILSICPIDITALKK